MADIKEYYGAIREADKPLKEEYPEGFLFVTSVKNLKMGSTAGAVSEVSTWTAAKHLVDVTARVSTKQEIEDHKARAAKFSHECAQKEYNRKQQTVVVVNSTGEVTPADAVAKAFKNK